VHLMASALGSLTARPVPDAMLCAASCHTRAEIERAAALNLDFVVLGPVRPTPTHPGARTLARSAAFRGRGGSATMSG